jgi:hypothetical protein
MTSLTNEQLVAEFYWSLRAIKEATGVTTKCWRPVSLICHIGLSTFLMGYCTEKTNAYLFLA